MQEQGLTKETPPTLNLEEIPELGTVLWASLHGRQPEQLILSGFEKHLYGEREKVSYAVTLLDPRIDEKYTKLLTEEGLYEQGTLDGQSPDLIVFKSEEAVTAWKDKQGVAILQRMKDTYLGERAYLIGRLAELRKDISNMETYLKDVEKRIEEITEEINTPKK